MPRSTRSVQQRQVHTARKEYGKALITEDEYLCRRSRANFFETNLDKNSLKDLKFYQHHHNLNCGHVVRSTRPECASNCQVDEMLRETVESRRLACYICDGPDAWKTVDNGTVRDSAPGVMHFLLKNDSASLTNRSKCCGSSGAKYMLRNTKQRNHRPKHDESKRKRLVANDSNTPKKRVRKTAPPMDGPTTTLAFRPSVVHPSYPAPVSPPRVESSAVHNSAYAAPKVVHKAITKALAKPAYDVGESRRARSQRVWEVHGEQCNINSMLNTFKDFSGTETASTLMNAHHQTLDQTSDAENNSDSCKSSEDKIALNGRVKIEDTAATTPSARIKRESPPPPAYIKLEPDDDIDYMDIFIKSEAATLIDPASFPATSEEAKWFVQEFKAEDDVISIVDSEDEEDDHDTFPSSKDLVDSSAFISAHVKQEELYPKLQDFHPSNDNGVFVKDEAQEFQTFQYHSPEEDFVLPLVMENGLEYIDLCGPYYAPVIKIEDDEYRYQEPTQSAFQLAFRPHYPMPGIKLPPPDMYQSRLDDDVMDGLLQSQSVYAIDPNLY